MSRSFVLAHCVLAVAMLLLGTSTQPLVRASLPDVHPRMSAARRSPTGHHSASIVTEGLSPSEVYALYFTKRESMLYDMEFEVSLPALTSTTTQYPGGSGAESLAPNLSQQEFQALKDLYYNCSGDHWAWDLKLPASTRWNFSNPDANPCQESWQGIQCSCQNATYTHPRESAFYYFYVRNFVPYFQIVCLSI